MKGYRPWLDGVRAVAIGLVLLAHFAYGIMPPGAGYVGVGLFFGLSGYLITGLLLDERQLSLFGFYARRIGRLMPGLVIMVAVTTPIFVVLADPNTAWRAAGAAVTYTTNIGQILGTQGSSPYAQTWSLAIEEHFYLLWAPVVAWVAPRFGVRGVIKAALVGAVLSVGWRLAIAWTWGSWVWVARGTFARGDALLVGCVLAAGVRCGWRLPRWSIPASAAVLVVCANKLTDGLPLQLAIGLTAVSVASAVLVAALDQHQGPVTKALSSGPALWLGTRSYSAYLWHYPILTLAPNIGLPVIEVLGLSLAVADLSYRFVERPARAAVRRRLDKRGTVRTLEAAPTAVRVSKVV